MTCIMKQREYGTQNLLCVGATEEDVLHGFITCCDVD
jgi:hypothetical protein